MTVVKNLYLLSHIQSTSLRITRQVGCTSLYVLLFMSRKAGWNRLERLT